MSIGAPSTPPAEREPIDEATFTRTGTAPDGRRVHARFVVDLDVTLVSDHNFYAGFAENLSVGGIFVATHKLLPVGEIIKLAIRLPRHPTSVDGVGQVCWVRDYSERSNVPPGLGLKFVELADGGAEAIRNFLEQRDPLFFDD
jgi:uncharacterized protein (TIGR02266 family)